MWQLNIYIVNGIMIGGKTTMLDAKKDAGKYRSLEVGLIVCVGGESFGSSYYEYIRKDMYIR